MLDQSHKTRAVIYDTWYGICNSMWEVKAHMLYGREDSTGSRPHAFLAHYHVRHFVFVHFNFVLATSTFDRI